MRRLGPVLTLLVGMPAVLGLAGCSGSSHKATVPPSTSTTAPGSNSSTSSTKAPSTTATSRPAATTTTLGGSTTSFVPPKVFSRFTSSPRSPVACNAPSMIELKWTALGVSSVDLAIDGRHAGTFPGGDQDHLQYFACDGKKHSYTLSAKRGSTTETATLVITSKAPS